MSKETIRIDSVGEKEAVSLLLFQYYLLNLFCFSFYLETFDH